MVTANLGRFLVAIALAASMFSNGARSSEPESCIKAANTSNWQVAELTCTEEATSGHSYAQYLLGHMYEGGKVAQDFGKAAHWYRQAAYQGHEQAQFYLAEMHYHGRGVPQDYREARHWYMMAARNGNNLLAHFQLGVIFNEGQGTEKDLSQALYWFKLAAQKGHTPSAELIAKIRPYNAPQSAEQSPLHPMTAGELYGEMLRRNQRLSNQQQIQPIERPSSASSSFLQDLGRAIAGGLNAATANMNRENEMRRRALIEQNAQPVPRLGVHCTTTVDTSFGLNTARTFCTP